MHPSTGATLKAGAPVSCADAFVGRARRPSSAPSTLCCASMFSSEQVAGAKPEPYRPSYRAKAQRRAPARRRSPASTISSRRVSPPSKLSSTTSSAMGGGSFRRLPLLATCRLNLGRGSRFRDFSSPHRRGLSLPAGIRIARRRARLLALLFQHLGDTTQRCR